MSEKDEARAILLHRLDSLCYERGELIQQAKWRLDAAEAKAKEVAEVLRQITATLDDDTETEAA